jgi:hypothetical protein
MLLAVDPAQKVVALPAAAMFSVAGVYAVTTWLAVFVHPDPVGLVAVTVYVVPLGAAPPLTLGYAAVLGPVLHA